MKKIYLITEGFDKPKTVGASESKTTAKKFIKKHFFRFPRIEEVKIIDDLMDVHIYRVTFDTGTIKCETVDSAVDEINAYQVVDKENFGILEIVTLTATTQEQAISKAKKIIAKGKCGKATGE